MCFKRRVFKPTGSPKRAWNCGAGIKSKASFVGANTVNGPGWESRDIRFPAFTRDIKVEKAGLNTNKSRIEQIRRQAPTGT